MRVGGCVHACVRVRAFVCVRACVLVRMQELLQRHVDGEANAEDDAHCINC